MLKRKLFCEIDKTIDQIITNTEAINLIDKDDLELEEIEGFNKTQESLIAHLYYIEKKAQESNIKLNEPLHITLKTKLKNSKLKKNPIKIRKIRKPKKSTAV
jgi:hypothetical protein